MSWKYLLVLVLVFVSGIAIGSRTSRDRTLRPSVHVNDRIPDEISITVPGASTIQYRVTAVRTQNDIQVEHTPYTVILRYKGDSRTEFVAYDGR